MSQTNQNEVFHYQYWILTDPALAEQMGINTDPASVGDLYLLRKKSVFTQDLKPNVNLRGYDFISQKIYDYQVEKENGPDEMSRKILEFAFNQPIIIKNYQQYFSIVGMFRASIVLAYVDPNDKEQS
jgi:hypothetical protein